MVRHPNTVCLLCSETRLKSHYGITLADRQDFRPQGTGRSCARLFKIFYAWREEHPAVYDAAMDRITRWVPELKAHFEEKVKRKQCKAMQNRKRCQAYTASARSEYCRACCTNLRRRNIVHRASEMERASLAGIFKPLRARGNAPLKR